MQLQGVCGHRATGRHRGFIIIEIKLNLFHQSKLGRDVELQNTRIVLFKSPRDVHQVATISVQLGLGSALVDSYRDATFVPFGHLLIDLSPRTDDRLRYCTNNSLYSPGIPALFPRMQNSVSENLSKRISQRVHRQPAERKLVRSKKKSRPKVRRRNSRTVFNTNNLEATKESPFVAKFIAQKKTSAFDINHLS